MPGRKHSLGTKLSDVSTAGPHALGPGPWSQLVAYAARRLMPSAAASSDIANEKRP